MISTQVIKVTAKAALKGHYLQAVSVGLIFLFSIFITILTAEGIVGCNLWVSLYYYIVFAFLLLMILPLFLGLLRYFWRLYNNCPDRIDSVFYYFSSGSRYRRAMEFVWSAALRIFVCAIPCMLPAFAVRLFSVEETYERLGISAPEFLSVLGTLSFFLMTAGFLAIFLLCLRWHLAPFLLVADEAMHPHDTFRVSVIISRGAGQDFLQLVFGYIGWIVLALLMLPLPFLLPRFFMAYLVHARFAVAQYNRTVTAMPAQPTVSF